MIQSLYMEGYVQAVRTEINKLSVGLDARNHHARELDFEKALGVLHGSDKIEDSEITDVLNTDWSLLVYDRGPLQPATGRDHARSKRVRTGWNVGVDKAITRKFKPAQFAMRLRFLTNSLAYADKIVQWYFVEGTELQTMQVSIDMDGEAANYSVGILHDPGLTQEDKVQQEGTKSSLYMVGWDVDLVGLVISPLSAEYEKVDKVCLEIFGSDNPTDPTADGRSPILHATLERDI